MLSDRSDQELLLRYARSGAEADFGVLVQRHVDLVYGAAFRQVKESGVAEEVAQNVFITLARRAPFLTGHPSLAGWLYRTAVNQARQQARSEQRRRQREALAAQLANQMHSNESDPLGAVLDEALLELRTADREALLLRYFENKSLREVGLALGVGEDAAQKRVAKALDALTERFRRRGYAASAAATTVAALRAGVQAAPAGLAATATRAALSAGGLSFLGAGLARVLGLSKPQTLALCTAILMVPTLWQGARLMSVRGEAGRLETMLAALQTQQDALALDQEEVSRRLRRASNSLAQFRARGTAVALSLTATDSNLDPRLFRWDDAADYVRVPKTALRWLAFDGKDYSWSPGSYPEEEQVMSLEGRLGPTLLMALGLNSAQQQHLQRYFHDCVQQYRAFAEEQAQVRGLEALPANLPGWVRTNADTRVWLIPNLTATVADWKRQFEAGLAELAGPERAALILRQAAEDRSLGKVFQAFGANQFMMVVTPLPDGGSYWAMTHVEGGQLRWNGYQPRSALGDILAGKDDSLKNLLSRPVPAPMLDYLRQWLNLHSDSVHASNKPTPEPR